jgi:membrane protease YdiL (CAAX protease family)
MKSTFTQKHVYITAVLVGLLCTFMTALGMAVPQIIGVGQDYIYEVATIFLAISIGIGILIMKKSRFQIREYGLQKNKAGSYKKVWWYLPLVIIEILPFAACGLATGITVIQYVILALFTIAVGFNEEIYFRGLMIKFLSVKGSKKAIILSSVIFGVLHLANALNGKNVLYLVLQMFFAFLVGFVLAEIVTITKSLWILIIWHASHDFISGITGDTMDIKALILVAIQILVLLIYAGLLWKQSGDRVENGLESEI